MRRIFNVLILIPLAIVLIALMVANRTSVPFSVDVFNPGNPALTVHAPLFVWLVLAAMIGVVVGGFGAWLKQGKYRKQGRDAEKEAKKLRYEVEHNKGTEKGGATTGKSLIMQR